MGKTNFSKMEAALDKELLQMTVAQLLEAAGKGNKRVPNILRQRLLTLQQDLRWLLKDDKHLYTALEVTQDDLVQLLKAKADTLKKEDWTRVAHLERTCQKLKKELGTRRGTADDEALIEKERQKHLKKRFNVNDKWLPLK